MVSRWQEARSREGAARRQRKRPRRPTHPLRAGLLSRRAGRPPLRRQVRLPRLPAPRARLGEAAHPLRAARRHRRRGARGHSSRARGRGCARAAFREAPRNRPQARCSARGRAPSQRRAARQSGRTRRAEICGDAPGCAGIASRFAARVASRDTAKARLTLTRARESPTPLLSARGCRPSRPRRSRRGRRACCRPRRCETSPTMTTTRSTRRASFEASAGATARLTAPTPPVLPGAWNHHRPADAAAEGSGAGSRADHLRDVHDVHDCARPA